MAARTNKSHPDEPHRPMYGDGASLRLYAGSNQDMIILPGDWNPISIPPQSADLFLEIRYLFMTNPVDPSNESEKDSHSV